MSLYTTVVIIIIGLFATMLFINIYFRVKVFKAYKKLVQNNVDFGAVHIFDTKRLKSEVIPRYPKHEQDILTFVSHIRYSVKMASVLIGLITIFGFVSLYLGR